MNVFASHKPRCFGHPTNMLFCLSSFDRVIVVCRDTFDSDFPCSFAKFEKHKNTRESRLYENFDFQEIMSAVCRVCIQRSYLWFRNGQRDFQEPTWFLNVFWTSVVILNLEVSTTVDRTRPKQASTRQWVWLGTRGMWWASSRSPSSPSSAPSSEKHLIWKNIIICPSIRRFWKRKCAVNLPIQFRDNKQSRQQTFQFSNIFYARLVPRVAPTVSRLPFTAANSSGSAIGFDSLSQQPQQQQELFSFDLNLSLNLGAVEQIGDQVLPDQEVYECKRKKKRAKKIGFL